MSIRPLTEVELLEHFPFGESGLLLATKDELLE